MNMIPSNPVSIKVGNLNYSFKLEEPSLTFWPASTLVVLVDRHQADAHPTLLPTFYRTHLAVDTGLTSLEMMGCLGGSLPTHAVMTATIQDQEHMKQYMTFFKALIMRDAKARKTVSGFG
jgi:hypothetical protein